MKVLLCHNHYQHTGGEDRVFADEAALLESRGHQVIRFTMHNDSIDQMSRIDLARKTIWNSETVNQLGDLLRRHHPDVMHCTNTFPLISPAAYYTAKNVGVSVVQSLHNYRMLCPKAQFLRDGKTCQKCLGKSIPWPAIRHACYRDNRQASTVVTAMSAFHRWKRTWTRNVDRFIAPTQFVKQKHVEGGLPADKVDVKPNFVFPDPGPGSGEGSYAVYAGRLSPEKGVETLLRGWAALKRDLTLKILGDGPMASDVKRAAQSDRRIQWHGYTDPAEVRSIVGRAQCLIMPSICFETFGLSIAEAFAKATPVIASRIGALAELVDDGRTGFLFQAGKASDLAGCVERLMERSPGELREEARSEYEQHYTAESNYERLIEIYQCALRPNSTASPIPAC